MALCFVFSSLSICLYWLAGISRLLEGLSNLMCKQGVADDAKMLALSTKSC